MDAAGFTWLSSPVAQDMKGHSEHLGDDSAELFGENKRIAPERGVGKPPLTELLGSVAHEHL